MLGDQALQPHQAGVAEQVRTDLARSNDRFVLRMLSGSLRIHRTDGFILTRKDDHPIAAGRMLRSSVSLACTLATALMPHLLKAVIDQERPDRLTVRGHLRGVPFSGKGNDAFPSGHALHVKALASAATLLPAKARNTLWAVGSSRDHAADPAGPLGDGCHRGDWPGNRAGKRRETPAQNRALLEPNSLAGPPVAESEDFPSKTAYVDDGPQA